MNAKNIRTLLVCVVVCVALVGGFFALKEKLHKINEEYTDPFRALGAGEVMLAYLKENDNNWPSNWEELELFMGDRKFIGIGDFAELKKHVEIDFAFSPSSVDRIEDMTPEKLPFRAIWLRNGRQISHQVSPEPNTMIFRYLKYSKR